MRRTLQMADARFNQLWSVSQARVLATKGLMHLTLLVSLAVTSYGIVPAYYFERYDPQADAFSAWMTAIQTLSERLTLGLMVCIALCGVSTFFEGRLIRRKASWRLFHAAALDALHRE